MTEQKLILAAEALPTPKTEFAAIVHNAESLMAPTRPVFRWKRAIALMLSLLLLGGCAAGAVNYSYWAGPTWYHSYSDAARLSAQLNALVPEELGSSPFYDVTTIHTTTQDDFWMLSWLFYRYKTVALQYGTEGIVTVTVNGKPEEAHGVLNNIYLQFGSTENELWRDIFPFTDEGIWCDEKLTPDTYASESYKSTTLHSGILTINSSKLNKVIWIDESLHVCFMMSSSDYTIDELLAFSKDVIDLNHPD